MGVWRPTNVTRVVFLDSRGIIQIVEKELAEKNNFIVEKLTFKVWSSLTFPLNRPKSTTF